jgi:hypothetical protein
MFFRQLLTLALVSLMIHVTRLLLLIEMQKHSSITMRNIFQNNLHIAARNSLSYSLANIRRNLRITTHSFLSCPPVASVAIYASLRTTL